MAAGGSEVGVGYVSLVPSAAAFGPAVKAMVMGQTSGVGKTVGTRMGSEAKSGFLGSFKGVAKTLAGLFVVHEGISFFKEASADAREAQKVQAVTAQVIKATGGAAKVTAKQVADMASAMALNVGIDHDTIEAGSNVLLTFKNIRNEVGKGNDIFDRANQAMLDISAVLKSDLPGAAKMLGKALNDPLQGMSAMMRYGIQFTAQQKAQIKALVESGHTLEAQQIILGEVESKFGGGGCGCGDERGQVQGRGQGVQRVVRHNDAADLGLVDT